MLPNPEKTCRELEILPDSGEQIGRIREISGRIREGGHSGRSIAGMPPWHGGADERITKPPATCRRRGLHPDRLSLRELPARPPHLPRLAGEGLHPRP